MIQLEKVTKQYPNGQFGLQNVSLSIPENHLIFFCGPTGAGKTTLAKLLALRLRPTQGKIMVDDTNLADLNSRQIAQYRRSIGMVFNDLPLLENQSIGDNVALPLQVNGTPASKQLPRVSNALDTVGLRNKLEMFPADLSDIELQRVRIARATVTRPALIIADEPTVSMDSQLGGKIMQVFKRIADRNTTVIVTTHDRAHLTDGRHPVFELRRGQIFNVTQGAAEPRVN